MLRDIIVLQNLYINGIVVKVLEYLEDLRFYSRTGHHGYQADMNKKLGCPLVKDMITRFT